ncbi:MAG: VOC family protein [Actinobacteria bacterium]|nr:VOC family protein [Actinomycetota bacterium]NIS34563.1 VOC family protein [Actinomycetota bacterium]NIT97589.1 VOC family protein [Actinomycetota bacterium]NIU21242.1 VOC family protein [Actinomycetota bacterium]NIU69327.1 VOC family protein [Actinomycetota bacterium]
MTQILSQFAINVRDMDRALEFWRDVCELPVVNRVETPTFVEVMLQSEHGGSRLQLAHHFDDDDPIEIGTGIWKIYVNTSDCRGLYDRAIAAGCESVSEPTKPDQWPVTLAFVKDFDGYLVELVEHHEGTRPGVPDPKQVGSE